jgi:hypothetical protein
MKLGHNSLCEPIHCSLWYEGKKLVVAGAASIYPDPWLAAPCRPPQVWFPSSPHVVVCKELANSLDASPQLLWSDCDARRLAAGCCLHADRCDSCYTLSLALAQALLLVRVIYSTVLI